MNIQSDVAALRARREEVTVSEWAMESCRLAKQLEKIGEYEPAYEILSSFWPNRHQAPDLDGLDKSAQAEVLLRVGSVAGWLGSTDQIPGGQEMAKNLITKALEIFAEIQPSRVADARCELGLCYWREGSYDEARITLANALDCAPAEDSDLRAIILVRMSTVEMSARRLSEVFRILNASASLVEKSTDHALKGAYHNAFAIMFRRLVTEENRDDYVDRALIEYAAASFHFEQAGNYRNLARVENNVGYLFLTIGRYKDAHAHLNRARNLSIQQNDLSAVAQVDDTRARTLLAEGHVAEAERVARYAVRTLEKGDEQAVLAEAMTTRGTALARLGDYASARKLFQRAIEMAMMAGDLEGAGRTHLSILEELSGQTTPSDQASIYLAAADLLKSSQDPSTGERLIACAGTVIQSLQGSETIEPEPTVRDWNGFSFKREIKRIEKELIQRALRDAGGSVTKASRMLGFKHHQSLISIIQGRHRDLLKSRSAVRKRRQHLFSLPRKARSKAVLGAEAQVSSLPARDLEDDAKIIEKHFVAAED